MFKRLNTCQHLKNECIAVRVSYNMFKNTNFGTGGNFSRVLHNEIAEDYNSYKYFWMKDIELIP